MKVAVVGKGGAGKTTVSGTIARAFGQSGYSVIALDADANPMLGISVGLGPERTDEVVSARQALAEVEHEHSAQGIVDAFGTDAPDGVRLVVAHRMDRLDGG